MIGTPDGKHPMIPTRENDEISFHKFSTGAVRGTDANDTRFDLITPIGLRAVARAYAEGVAKYSPYNCERGIPVLDLLNHAIRHIYLFLEGDRAEDHLGHAGWNVLMACHSKEQWPELNAGTLREPGCKPPLPVEDNR